jgi:hypothetical protein
MPPSTSNILSLIAHQHLVALPTSLHCHCVVSACFCGSCYLRKCKHLPLLLELTSWESMSATNCLSMACSAFLSCNVSVISFSNLCTTESMTTSQTRIHRSAIHAIEPPHRPSMRTTTHQRNALNFLLILILWRQWQVWKNRAWSVQYC